MERMLIYISILSGFAIVEAFIGISFKNVHVVVDFIKFLFMVCALVFSLKALQMGKKAKDDQFNFGYRRFNILAAFINADYLIFTFIFDLVDNFHHLIESWDAENHHDHEAKEVQAHDKPSHQNETHYYLTLFAFLKILVISIYLIVENNEMPLQDYMVTNWLNWPHTYQRIQLKAKIKDC
mmetsp:Transcript_44198/g.42908  ORF Transcript_44198/g.42908 Transcript_44198/m.42908 type:complete len:181 (-) Transcript_44198:120-662(-)